jgi:putative nucleotidyltransferase with HDIG domain
MNKSELLALYPEMDLLEQEELKDKCLEAFLIGLDMFGWNERGGLANCPVNVGILPPDAPVGNLEHLRVVSEATHRAANCLTSWLAELGYTLNHDVAVAGALLHDVGKLAEYSRDENNQACYSETGPLFRHTVAGAFLAKKAGLPDDIVHIVLTHSHSQAPEGADAYETPEAVIAKGCDLCSWLTIESIYK